MFKVKNKNTRKTSILNFEHISNLFSIVFSADFEQVNVSWVLAKFELQ